MINEPSVKIKLDLEDEGDAADTGEEVETQEDKEEDKSQGVRGDYLKFRYGNLVLLEMGTEKADIVELKKILKEILGMFSLAEADKKKARQGYCG